MLLNLSNLIHSSNQNKNYQRWAFCLLAFVTVCFSQNSQAQSNKIAKPVPPVVITNNHLQYSPDSLGNRIPDFSYCGYQASETAIPTIAVKVVVPVLKGDATDRIQAAIDYVASLPQDKNGFRGTVLLQKGKYEVFGTLKINQSGIVLRGSGANQNGTELIGAGTDRATLIRVVGKNDKNKTKKLKSQIIMCL